MSTGIGRPMKKADLRSREELTDMHGLTEGKRRQHMDNQMQTLAICMQVRFGRPELDLIWLIMKINKTQQQLVTKSFSQKRKIKTTECISCYFYLILLIKWTAVSCRLWPYCSFHNLQLKMFQRELTGSTCNFSFYTTTAVPCLLPGICTLKPYDEFFF